MHAQPSDSSRPHDAIGVPGRRPSRDEIDCTQSAILALLFGQVLWSREELERALSADALTVTDAIAQLISDGLVHDLGGFILASRAARAFDRLDL